MTLAPNGYRCMMMDAAKIGVCVVLLVVIAIITAAVAGWLDPPHPPATPPVNFDAMIDSGNPGPAAHPCVSDPARSCFGFSLGQMPR